LTASLRLWPLVLGRRSIGFKARLFEGELSGVAEQGTSWQRIRLLGSGIELGRAAALRSALGLEIAGTLRADIDVTLDAKDPAKSAGHADLSLEKAAVNAGEMPIPGMGSGVLTLPRIELGNVVA